MRYFEAYETCGCVSTEEPRLKDLPGYCPTHGSERREYFKIGPPRIRKPGKKKRRRPQGTRNPGPPEATTILGEFLMLGIGDILQLLFEGADLFDNPFGDRFAKGFAADPFAQAAEDIFNDIKQRLEEERRRRRAQEKEERYENRRQAPPPPRPEPRHAIAEAFKVLRIPPESGKRETRQAFIQLVKQYHPDRFPESQRSAAHDNMATIAAAYQTLKDAGRA